MKRRTEWELKPIDLDHFQWSDELQAFYISITKEEHDEILRELNKTRKKLKEFSSNYQIEPEWFKNREKINE